MHDCIVVGAGPAGVFSAYQLRGKDVLVLDVGMAAEEGNRLPSKNIYDIKRDGDDVFDSVIGASFESLHNVFHDEISIKLKAPPMRYVTRRPDGVPAPVSDDFDACLSYAKGGLAAAWGAGVLRFNDHDLSRFPIRAAELEPFYDRLTQHIGITGTDDDLTAYFGSLADLQEPLPLSPTGSDFLRSYERNRERMNRRGIKIGRTRAAILSRDHEGRARYDFAGHDFLQPNIPAIYNPAYTLDDMVRRRETSYLSGKLVLSYREAPDSVQVTARDLASGAIETFEARYLLLAAGTINSALIVLASAGDRATRLPLLDNGVCFTPFLKPSRIGVPPDLHAFAGGELVAVYEGDLSSEPIQSSVYGLMGPLRADLAFQMPLTVRGNLAALRYVVPAIAVLQTFFPDEARSGNDITLLDDHRLAIRYVAQDRRRLVAHLCSSLRSMGYWSTPLLSRSARPGSSIHYAGALPMTDRPERPYQTSRDCLLFGHARTFVADAATFPHLPSKNLTFTIMANAMRVAEAVARLLQ